MMVKVEQLELRGRWGRGESFPLLLLFPQDDGERGR